MTRRASLLSLSTLAALMSFASLWSAPAPIFKGSPKTMTNSIGMKLAYIPPGKFTMGSPENEGGRNGVEGDETEHEVEITRGFYIGVYEVTQAEYEKVMGTNPSRFSAAGDYKAQVARLNTARFPVDSVDHGDAVDFCNSTVTDSQGPPSWAAPCRGGGKPPVLACQW